MKRSKRFLFIVCWVPGWGKGDKDVKKELRKTRVVLLDFSIKKITTKILLPNANG
jgi:hypothetical protein